MYVRRVFFTKCYKTCFRVSPSDDIYKISRLFSFHTGCWLCVVSKSVREKQLIFAQKSHVSDRTVTKKNGFSNSKRTN